MRIQQLGGQEIIELFLGKKKVRSVQQGARLLELCVTKNHTQNVSNLPEYQTLWTKPHTWMEPLEGQWKYLWEVGCCLNWVITPMYNLSKNQWRCGEKQNNGSQPSTIR